MEQLESYHYHIRIVPLSHSRAIMEQLESYHYHKRRTDANQSPKGARATDWPTIRSTTLLTAVPESVAQKSAF